MNNTKKAARFTLSDFNIRLARPKGFCPGTAVPIASLTLVAVSAKTVRRTVLKARVPSENTSTKVRSMSGVAVKKKGSSEKRHSHFLLAR